MGTDVAAFARQLKEEGIEAAKKEAAEILSEAKREAKKIVGNAEADAEQLEKEAMERIAQGRQRSEAEMKLVARDLVNGLRKTVEGAVGSLLKAKVAKQLNEEEVVKSAILELVKARTGDKGLEVALGEKLNESLGKMIPGLFKEKEGRVVLGAALKKSGFEIRNLEDGDVIEVTDESVAEAFMKFLSPELKKLV